MIVLDLFSGAGGLTEGFYRQNATFVGHVELDNHACNTLKTRQAYWNLKKQNKLDIYYDYLLKKIDRDTLWQKANLNKNEIINSEISDNTINSIFNQIKTNMKNKNIKEVDVIIGGPPCQAYSIAGRARIGCAIENDPRNYLFKYYVEFLKEFKPKMFVFENVPGLKTAGKGKYLKELIEEIENANYHLELKELVATEFGVLQNRKRIIIFGWNKDYFKTFKYPEFEKIDISQYKVSDLLKDLPKLEPNSKIEGLNKYTEKSNKYLQFSKIRSKNFNILTQHITRPTNERDRKIYQITINKWFKENKNLKYNELLKIDKSLVTHKNTKSFLNRFNVVKSNQNFSHTVVAHIAMDGHYYIHPDIEQIRSLSIREAARIQSFPDDFYFEGPRTSIFKQIGNAVPPLMAESIAYKTFNILTDLHTQKC